MKKDEYLRYLREVLGETLDSELTAKEVIDAFKEEMTDSVEYHTARLDKAKQMLDLLYGNNFDIGNDHLEIDFDSVLNFNKSGGKLNSSDTLDFTKTVDKLDLNTPQSINYKDQINPWDY